LYLTEERAFNPSNPSTLDKFEKAKIPQALEMVNQTVSIPAEPLKCRYFKKNLLEFKLPSAEEV